MRVILLQSLIYLYELCSLLITKTYMLLNPKFEKKLLSPKYKYSTYTYIILYLYFKVLCKNYKIVGNMPIIGLMHNWIFDFIV